MTIRLERRNYSMIFSPHKLIIFFWNCFLILLPSAMISAFSHRRMIGRKFLFSSRTLSSRPAAPIIHLLEGAISNDASLDELHAVSTKISVDLLQKKPEIKRLDILRHETSPNQFLLSLVETSKDQYEEAYGKLKKELGELKSTSYQIIYPSPNLWKINIAPNYLQSISKSLPTYLMNHPWELKAWETKVTTDGNIQRGGLFAVYVEVNVIPGKEEEFIQYTLHNCQNSHLESGVHRFDFLQNVDNPSQFLLVEIYNNEQAPIKHKQTEHYHLWAKNVASLMAKPRNAKKYITIFPSPLLYHKVSEVVYQSSSLQFLSTHYTNLLQQVEQQHQQQQHQTTADNDFTNIISERGLNDVISQSFGFQSPKIAVGRNIAGNTIQSTFKAHRVQRPLIITGKTGSQRYATLFQELFSNDTANNGYHYVDYIQVIDGEPTVEDAIRVRDIALKQQVDGILAIGGGSAIDLGKAVAALVPNSHRDIFDFLEVIGKGQPIEYVPLPFIAVPTTSGTGSEATKNAVLKSVSHGRKVSMRHDWMFPTVAVIDPMLILSCPPSVTANVGMDTLCQVLEPYVCNAPNPMVDALSREGIIRASRSLRNAVAQGEWDITAREDMAIAAVFGGLSLANARLGAVHGYAAVLGGMFEDAPHGAICARLLPYVFEANVKALEKIVNSTSADSSASSAGSSQQQQQQQQLITKLQAIKRLQRFEAASQWMTGNPSASITDGIDWLHALLQDIDIPRLSSLCRGVDISQFDHIATQTLTASSTRGNPVILSKEDLVEILQKSL
jgi:alcohol dehydrogenase class IV/quinol monooxygenase YgiN